MYPQSEAVLTSTHNLCFEQKYRKFHLKLSIFTAFKILCVMYGNVYVMHKRQRNKQLSVTFTPNRCLSPECSKATLLLWLCMLFVLMSVSVLSPPCLCPVDIKFG